MLVIADGGSSKVDWRFVSNRASITTASSIGFNPFFFTTEQIIAELNKTFISSNPVDAAKEVFFYGSGCSDEKRCTIIHHALQKIFPNAERIEVTHDLLAAARATCQDQRGISCILGTGSNSCLYDGFEIIDNITSLGFVLGDEGSGAYLGKLLVKSYFYREMPDSLRQLFAQKYKIDKSNLLSKIHGDSPNVYLASFSKFATDHLDHAFMQSLVATSFDDFLSRHILKYKDCEELKIHFVGSIAFHFKEVLVKCLQRKNLTLGKVIKQPIDSLVQFHLNAKIK